LQVVKHLIIQFSSVFRHLLSLSSKYSTQRPVPNTLKLWSHNMEDQVPHPYKNRGWVRSITNAHTQLTWRVSTKRETRED